jgi:hypothetical protein
MCCRSDVPKPLHATHYKFVRIRETLKVMPAMAAGVIFQLWKIGDVVDMLDAWAVARRRDAGLTGRYANVVHQ